MNAPVQGWPGAPQAAGPMWTTPMPISTMPIPWEQRQAILGREVQSAISRGARLQSADQFSAVLIFGKPVNHVLHAILTIFLLGLWLIPWLLMAATGGEKREMISVDEYGAVRRQRV